VRAHEKGEIGASCWCQDQVNDYADQTVTNRFSEMAIFWRIEPIKIHKKMAVKIL